MTNNDWKYSKLSEVTSLIKDGTHGTHNDSQNGIPLLSAKDIFEGEIHMDDSPRRISTHDYDMIHKNYEIKNNDILLTVVGTIGRAAIVKNIDRKFTIQRSVAVIRANTNILPEYCYQYILSKQFQDSLVQGAQGLAQAGVYLQELGKIQVLLPPITTQRKISLYLDLLDVQIQKTNQLIQNTKILRQGLLSELLSKGLYSNKLTKTNLGYISESWKLEQFTKVTLESKERNESEKLGNELIYGVNKVHGLIPMKERTKGKQIKRYKLVSNNWFAYNPMRLNIGSIAYNESLGDVLVSPDYVVFKCDEKKMLPDYMNYFRQSIFWTNFTKRSGDGSVRVRIYYSHLAPLLIPLPPIDEQRQIVDILESIDLKLSNEIQTKESLIKLKSGLMNDIFTRKVEVN